VQQNEYTVFNPTICAINNKLSFVIYDLPPICFGLYKAIFREVVYEGVKIQQILSKNMRIFDRISCICIPMYTALMTIAL
jgi:hypothetical protein